MAFFPPVEDSSWEETLGEDFGHHVEKTADVVHLVVAGMAVVVIVREFVVETSEPGSPCFLE